MEKITFVTFQKWFIDELKLTKETSDFLAIERYLNFNSMA